MAVNVATRVGLPDKPFHTDMPASFSPGHVALVEAIYRAVHLLATMATQRICSRAAASSWQNGRTTWPIQARRQEGIVDEIQRWLEASLAEGAPDITREALLQNMSGTSEDRLYWQSFALMMSDASSWWYDTVQEYVRRIRRRNAPEATPLPPRTLAEWCLGVAAGDIKRPRSRGRPTNAARDQLIGMALEKYRDLAGDGEAISDSEAFGLVADVVGLDDSVVAKIWRRHRRGRQ